MLHLHRFNDVIHVSSLDVIIELLDYHIGRVDCHCLVKSHGHTVGHDYLHIASHLCGTNRIRKNKLNWLLVSFLSHWNFCNLIFGINVTKYILIECFECSLAIYTQSPYCGERARIQACRLYTELVRDIWLCLQYLSSIAPRDSICHSHIYIVKWVTIQQRRSHAYWILIDDYLFRSHHFFRAVFDRPSVLEIALDHLIHIGDKSLKRCLFSGKVYKPSVSGFTLDQHVNDWIFWTRGVHWARNGGVGTGVWIKCGNLELILHPIEENVFRNIDGFWIAQSDILVRGGEAYTASGFVGTLPHEGSCFRVGVVDGSEGKGVIWWKETVAALNESYLNRWGWGLYKDKLLIVLSLIIIVEGSNLDDICGAYCHIIWWNRAINQWPSLNGQCRVINVTIISHLWVVILKWINRIC